jgi:hypothetical protein
MDIKTVLETLVNTGLENTYYFFKDFKFYLLGDSSVNVWFRPKSNENGLLILNISNPVELFQFILIIKINSKNGK